MAIENNPEVHSWARWLFGGIATAAAIAWATIRQTISQSHKTVKQEMSEALEQQTQRLNNHGERIGEVEKKVEVHGAKLDAGERDRADIKKGISEINKKVDRLIGHMLDDK